MSWTSLRGEEMKHLLDTEFLIAVVEQYPVLWDKEDHLYKCSNSTAKAWKDVCRAMFLNYDTLEDHEKNCFVQVVMKRWKNVRDAWAKAQKRLVNDNLTLNGRFPKKYVFQDQLAFLKKVIKIKGNDSTLADDSECESEAASEIEQDSDSATTEPALSAAVDEVYPEPNAAPCNSKEKTNIRKRKINLDGYEDRPIYLTRSTKPDGASEKDNRHMLFFRSLVPSLNQLNEEQVLEFQVGVLKLMQNVRKTSSDSCAGNNWKIEECSP